MRWVFIFLPSLFIFSCNTNNTSSELNKDSSSHVRPGMKDGDTSTVASPTSEKNWSGCYWKLLQRDTFVLHLKQSNSVVDGKLTFNNFQKDKSTGTVQGKIEGDIVKLWYSFQSEGMNSVMEIYFRKQDDGLVRGFGPVEVRGDTAYFKSEKDIVYNADQTFSNVECSQLPGKYR